MIWIIWYLIKVPILVQYLKDLKCTELKCVINVEDLMVCFFLKKKIGLINKLICVIQTTQMKFKKKIN